MPDPAVAGSPVTQRLLHGAVELVGRLVDASNAAFLARVSGDREPLLAIYKPVAGERPLWDFPDGTLAGREVAASLLSAAGGWDIVPETVLREGPHGLGSLQRWVGDPQTEPEYVVDVVPVDAVPDGWLPVLQGEGADGRPVVVVHQDSPEVMAAAAFDAVINNSDRKGSHLVQEGPFLRGFDHGVSFHEQDKLRTVLWGFAGRPLPATEIHRLRRVDQQLSAHGAELAAALDGLLTPAEVRALRARVTRLLEQAAYPLPGEGWPAIPWPPL